MKKIAMIGVGKLGQDCAEIMATQYDVVGYDIEPRSPSFPMVDSIATAVRDRELIFIAAPTPHDPLYGGEHPTSHLEPKDFDYSIVQEILTEVNRHVTRRQLVVLISTVLPGTVRNILKPCITNARFIYNPYLIAMGTIKYDMVNPEMIIIGTNDGILDKDAEDLMLFYRPLMQNDPRTEIGTYEEAESIKIFYNTFISAKISLVNMIQDVSQKIGNINVDIVTNALAKSSHRIMGPAYMTAGMGDGGACHPRDNIALRYLSQKLNLGYDIFDSIMTAREQQAKNLAEECVKHGKKIIILGKSYKPGVPYTNGSSSILVAHYINLLGGEVFFHDPHTNDEYTHGSADDVFLIGYHDEYTERYVFPNESTIIDPWRKIDIHGQSHRIVHYGNTRFDSPSNDPNRFFINVSHQIIDLRNLWSYFDDIIQDSVVINCYRYPGTAWAYPDEQVVSIIKGTLTNKNHLIFCNMMESFWLPEIDRIHRWIQSLQLSGIEIYYVTGSVDASIHYESWHQSQNYQDKLKIISVRAMEWNSQFNNLVQLSSPYDEYVVGARSKLFLCLNRIARIHRICFLGLMSYKGLLDTCYYSYYDNTQHLRRTTHEFVKQYMPTVQHEIMSGLLQVHDALPLRLTLDENANNPLKMTDDDTALFRDSYLSIINETNGFLLDRKNGNSGTIFLTEKTFNAILQKHPFIIIAIPGTLNYLQKVGYKTFHPYINESYDNELDDEKRLMLIMNEIERLSRFSQQEWKTWQDGVRNNIEHNFSLLTSLKEFVVDPKIFNQSDIRI